jgi:hypothetical protein
MNRTEEDHDDSEKIPVGRSAGPSGRLLGSSPFPLSTWTQGNDNWSRLGEASAPDIAFEFRPCLDKISPNLQTQVISALTSVFGSGTDIRYACSTRKNGFETGKIGIWLRRTKDGSLSDARSKGLASIDLLQAGENFAIFVNASYIRRSASATWDQMPKRLGDDNKPNPDGPIHLTGRQLHDQRH